MVTRINPILVSELLAIYEPADRVPMSMSSDGEWVAFSLTGAKTSMTTIGVSSAVSGNSQWVCQLKTGKLIKIAPSANNSWSGVWSPDGKILAFFSDQNGKAQLWLWFSCTGILQCASDVVVSPYFGLEQPIWIDQERIMVKTIAVETFTVVKNYDFECCKVQYFSTIEEEQPRVNNQWIDKYKADISIINILECSSNIIFSDARALGFALSPDKQFLAFTDCLGQQSVDSQQLIYDLWVCNISDQMLTVKVAESLCMNSGITFSWSVTNCSIICLTSEGHLILIEECEDEWRKRILTVFDAGDDYDIPVPLPNGDILISIMGKLWLHSAGNITQLLVDCKRQIISILPTRNNSKFIFQTYEPKDELYGFWQLELQLKSWKWNVIIEEPMKHRHWLESGAISDDKRLVYFAESASEPPAIYIYNLDKSNIEKIVISTMTKPLGTAEKLTWEYNGKQTSGVLLLPPKTNTRVPVIIRVYGGLEQSRYIRSFGLCDGKADNHHLFASCGYAVFRPDLVMDRVNEPAQEIVSSLEKAILELSKHPSIDVNEMGIIGHSFGGYSALATITKLPFFKAAVISAGISNLISYSTYFDPQHPDFRSGWTESGQGDMGGTLWQQRERYIRNSPLFDFDKIDCPVLIIQGTKDASCYPEAGPMYAALRRLGKTAAMALYDEDHWQGTWKEENLEDYYNRCIQWFEKYLK